MEIRRELQYSSKGLKKMSKENRRKEFIRLMDLGRQKDIPPELWAEFKPKDKIVVPVKAESGNKKVK